MRFYPTATSRSAFQRSLAMLLRFGEVVETFFTLQEWIKDTLGIEKLKDHDLFHNYAKIKYDLWQYEEEWRVCGVMTRIQ